MKENEYKKSRLNKVLKLSISLALVVAAVAGLSGLGNTVPILFGGANLSYAENGDASGEEEGRKKLFALYAEIELTESKRKKLLYEIQDLKKQIKDYEKEISLLEKESGELLEEYAVVLRARQKLGMGANVASLLASKGLRDFLHRATALGDITRSVAALNDKILASMDAVENLKQKKEQGLEEVFALDKEHRETLKSMKKAAADLEKYLEQKGEERAAAEAELALMEAKWTELKHTFEKVVKDVTGIIERGGIPRESVELQIGFTGVSVILREENFNRVLKDFLEKHHPEIAPMEFKLADDGVYVKFPSHEVELFGNFEVKEQSMHYVVERGTYNGMEMPQSSLDDLFLNREMVFNFKTLVGKSKLKSCTIYDGYIKIDVDLKF